jgi:hypothetical protein
MPVIQRVNTVFDFAQKLNKKQEKHQLKALKFFRPFQKFFTLQKARTFLIFPQKISM